MERYSYMNILSESIYPDAFRIEWAGRKKKEQRGANWVKLKT